MRSHELDPALVEVPMVAFAQAIFTGPGAELLVVSFVPEPHLIVQWVAPRHHPPAGLGTCLPVVHVVLLEGA